MLETELEQSLRRENDQLKEDIVGLLQEIRGLNDELEMSFDAQKNYEEELSGLRFEIIEMESQIEELNDRDHY